MHTINLQCSPLFYQEGAVADAIIIAPFVLTISRKNQNEMLNHSAAMTAPIQAAIARILSSLEGSRL